MLNRLSDGKFARTAAAMTLVVLGTLMSDALAADRIVLAEKFTATW